MKALVFYFIIINILCYACTERGIELEFPFEGEKLKVSGFLVPESHLSLALSKTRPVKDLLNSNFVVPNAIIFLYEDGIQIEQLEFERNTAFSESLYKGKYLLQEGKSYSIEAAAPNLPTIISVPALIPPKTAIKQLLYDINETTANIQFKIEDDPKSDVLYFCQIRGHYISDSLNIDTIMNIRGNYLDDDEFGNSIQVVNFEEVNLLGRIRVNGKINRIAPKAIIVQVLTYSRSFEQYQESVADYDEEIGGFFQSSPFIFTNIKSGYGIIGAYNRDTITINL